MRVLALFCLLSAVAAPRAEAQDFAAAGQHFAAAQDAFTQGLYKRAAEEYQASYDITKDPALLFNIGESWQRAGDGQRALDAYRSYMREQPNGADRPEVDKRILSLEMAMQQQSQESDALHKAKQDAMGNRAGSQGMGETPPPPQPTATMPGNSSPMAVTPPVPEKKSAEPAKNKPNRLRTAAWIGVAVTVALATAGAIMGLGAQNRADELQRRTTVLLNGQPPVYDSNQADAYTSLVSEGNAYNAAAIGLLSIAGATAVTAAALFIADAVTHPKTEKLAALPAVPALAPSLAVLPSGALVSLAGSF